jgi:hypothetical protein
MPFSAATLRHTGQTSKAISTNVIVGNLARQSPHGRNEIARFHFASLNWNYFL